MRSYRVIIPINLKPSPSRNEISAAELLAKHFKANVEFIVRSNHKTPIFLLKVLHGSSRALLAMENVTYSTNYKQALNNQAILSLTHVDPRYTWPK